MNEGLLARVIEWCEAELAYHVLNLEKLKLGRMQTLLPDGLWKDVTDDEIRKSRQKTIELNALIDQCKRPG